MRIRGEGGTWVRLGGDESIAGRIDDALGGDSAFGAGRGLGRGRARRGGRGGRGFETSTPGERMRREGRGRRREGRKDRKREQRRGEGHAAKN